ncbi:MAG: tRNA-binding protein [Candidatus Heimdallarchaeaceae archaeon]
MISYEDFERVNIRVGKILKAEEFPEAKKPMYKLLIDFGEEIGVKKSSAQLVANYTLDGLESRLVACVINFPPRQIGPIKSEVLILGFPDELGEPVLIKPDIDVPLGGKLY